MLWLVDELTTFSSTCQQLRQLKRNNQAIKTVKRANAKIFIDKHID